MPTFDLDTQLPEVVGEKVAGILVRAFGILTVGDLLAHYPRRYARRGELTPISSLPVGEMATIVAEVQSVSERSMRQRRGKIVEVVISDGVGTATLTFFGQAWRVKELQPGRQGIFSGKVGNFKGQQQFAHPDYELFDDELEARVTAVARSLEPIPIYPATSTVTSWQIRKIIADVMARLGPVPDPLPDDLRRRRDLLDARTAFEHVHTPKLPEQVSPAFATLRMHEAFVLQAALLQHRVQVRLSLIHI